MKLRILPLSLLFLLTLSCSSCNPIYSTVKNTCISAKKEYGLNCLSSLIALIQSDTHSFEEKNRAVWTLGQLADKKALPFLHALTNGASSSSPCDRSASLCRREIDRAIQWCSKGNVTNWMYRKREDWK